MLSKLWSISELHALPLTLMQFINLAELYLAEPELLMVKQQNVQSSGYSRTRIIISNCLEHSDRLSHLFLSYMN